MNIFVFGSNREGRHGAGAALYARKYHGAQLGKAEGLQGSSYAIITKELRPNQPRVTLAEVRAGVRKFLAYAKRHPEHQFQLTAIGCGLADFTPGQIAPMFLHAPGNVTLPIEFR